MNKRQRVGLASTVVIGLMGLTGIVSVTTAGIASAAPQVSTLKLKGYTFAEADVSLPANAQGAATASCPSGDKVVGGGGYQVTQGLRQDLNSSYPDAGGTGWSVYFNNEASSSNTGVAVAICAAASSLSHYSVHYGALVAVPAGGEGQGTVTCPSGTVSLSGGPDMESAGTQTYEAANASAPFGTNGWRAYMGSAGADSTQGLAAVVCATEPAGWAQVSSPYVSNPAGKATTATVTCPSGTKVLGGGPFNSSADPSVTIGLTTSVSSLKGWHSSEHNNSSVSESVDEWAVCAQVVSAAS
jgi:hypothetical protein